MVLSDMVHCINEFTCLFGTQLVWKVSKLQSKEEELTFLLTFTHILIIGTLIRITENVTKIDFQAHFKAKCFKYTVYDPLNNTHCWKSKQCSLYDHISIAALPQYVCIHIDTDLQIHLFRLALWLLSQPLPQNDCYCNHEDEGVNKFNNQ